MILIKTYEELNNWLREYNYFEDGHVLKFHMNPFAINIGILISGNYEAYTEKEILCFKITPENIFFCEYSPDFKPSDDHYIETIEPLEFNRGVSLQIFGPPTLTLNAESLTISDPEIIKSTFKPWLNPKHIWLEVPMKKFQNQIFGKKNSKNKAMTLSLGFILVKANPCIRFLIRIILDTSFSLKVVLALVKKVY